jgi:hypothetical protein
LDVARRIQLRKEDLPTLIVFSGMQFDEAIEGSKWDTMYENICKQTDASGKELGWTDCKPPLIVSWNMRNADGHPVQKDTEGTVLLSGFSPSLLKHVLQGDIMVEKEIEEMQMDGTVITKKVRVTPAEIVRKMLDNIAYD